MIHMGYSNRKENVSNGRLVLGKPSLALRHVLVLGDVKVIAYLLNCALVELSRGYK